MIVRMESVFRALESERASLESVIENNVVALRYQCV
jgi:hypothetical protein